MALDGLFLYSTVNELKEKLKNGKVDKINQPEKDEIIINIRNNNTNYKLLICSNSSYPRIHLTKDNKKNPIKAPMFCMILRKYLRGGKIININQLNLDRILLIDFESTDELGFNSIYSLVIEIMGRHSNITLVRKRDNIIVDSIKHISSDVNSYRSLYPNIEYIYPPKSNKLNPLNFNKEDIENFISKNNIIIDENIFFKLFTGISKGLSSELFVQFKNKYEITTVQEILSFSVNLFKDIENKHFHFFLYKDTQGNVKDFHCIKLLNLSKNYIEAPYDSPSKLLEDFYYEKDKLDRLKSRSYNLEKLIETNLDRCYKKSKILEKSLEKCKSKDSYMLFGELLTANIYAVKKGMDKIEVFNYYNNEYLNIKLDKNKTPSQNIQSYYKKYNKLKNSEKMSKIQLDLTKDELNYLESVLTNLNNVENYEEIDEIKKELTETGYIKYKKEKKKKQNTSKPLHFLSSDGCNIYVGKNNMQNDYLTLKFANKTDIWLHTKNIHGSHVIIKNTGSISENTILEAASLAAYYSKARNSSNVPVDYTEIKNVKKPSGAKPGMVIYYTNKTLYVTPEKPALNKIQ